VHAAELYSSAAEIMGCGDGGIGFESCHNWQSKDGAARGILERHRASRLRSASAGRYAAACFSIGKQTQFSGAVWIIRSSLCSTSVGGNT